jgi:hypothetical protein
VEKEVLEDAKVYNEELKTNDETVSEKKKQEVATHHKWKAKAYKAQR